MESLVSLGRTHKNLDSSARYSFCLLLLRYQTPLNLKRIYRSKHYVWTRNAMQLLQFHCRWCSLHLLAWDRSNRRSLWWPRQTVMHHPSPDGWGSFSSPALPLLLGRDPPSPIPDKRRTEQVKNHSFPLCTYLTQRQILYTKTDADVIRSQPRSTSSLRSISYRPSFLEKGCQNSGLNANKKCFGQGSAWPTPTFFKSSVHWNGHQWSGQVSRVALHRHISMDRNLDNEFTPETFLFCYGDLIGVNAMLLHENLDAARLNYLGGL